MGYSNSGDNNRKHFTGYERDTETGLDYAQARYYANTQGRFTSPDPFAGSATIGNPQTFNRYVYCDNNPVNAVDPSGLSSGAKFSMNNMDGSDMGKGHSGFNTEREDAERDYEQRLQNTRDEIAANNALAVGQDDLSREIVSNNSALQAVDANGTDVTSDFVNGEPQDTSQHDSSNTTMVTVWAGGVNPFGHVSYTTMQDDTSYSWEGVWNWTIDKPSSQFTNKRSGGELGSEGMGYVLDFGNLNEKFQKALIHAYDSSYGGYGPISDNCGMAFNKAINAIRKDLQTRDNVKLPMSINIRPSKIREYIENNLMPRYVVAQQRFPWHK